MNDPYWDTLREPMDTQCIHISRAGHSVTFPAHFLLVAAMNPCYCGHYFDTRHACTCGGAALARYWRAVSKPLLDRFSICMVLQASDGNIGTTVAHRELTDMIVCARAIQAKRNPNAYSNQHLPTDAMLDICQLTPNAQSMLQTVAHINWGIVSGQCSLNSVGGSVSDCLTVRLFADRTWPWRSNYQIIISFRNGTAVISAIYQNICIF